MDKVLAPYVAGAPTGVVPLLFLDSYQVHKMALVNAAINNLGVEVVIIPPGCTGLTQPVDVGFNKPFKNNVRDHYEEWMMEAGRDLTVPPRRIDVARWIVAAEKDITSKILKNAWNRKSLEYFPLPKVAEANTLAGGVGVVGDESERDGVSGVV